MCALPLIRFRQLLSLTLLAGVCLVGPAYSQSLVTSRAALAGADHVDWIVLGDHISRVSNPFSLISSQGTGVFVSQTGHGLANQYGGLFATLRQAGTPSSEGTLNGNFAPGEALLDAQDGGTVSLSFPQGVYGGGAQLAVPTTATSGTGTFTVQVQAFDQNNALLASFTQSGTFNAKADGSAVFLGIVNASPNISRISYTGLTPHYSLFLNRFDIAVRPVVPGSHTHLLWANPDGRARLWNISPDGSYGVTSVYGPYPESGLGPHVTIGSGGVWQAVALATGPTGVSRLLWTSPSGRAVLWYIAPDGTRGDGGQFGPYTDGGGTWRATAVSVGADNLPHLLWNNPNGRAVLWDGHADGSYSDHGQYGPYTDGGGTWKTVALSVGADNLAHLLWDNPDGRAVLWNGKADGTYSDRGQYGPYTDGGGTWKATAVSVGPDNLPHLLWNSPGGRAVLWDGKPDGTFGDRGQYGPYTDGGGTWNALTACVGPDNLPRLLWANPDGRAVLWNGRADGTYGDHGPYGPYTDGGGVWRAVAVSAGP